MDQQRFENIYNQAWDPTTVGFGFAAGKETRSFPSPGGACLETLSSIKTTHRRMIKQFHTEESIKHAKLPNCDHALFKTCCQDELTCMFVPLHVPDHIN